MTLVPPIASSPSARHGDSGRRVRPGLVEEVVAYTRVHLGSATADGLGADASDEADLILDAVCLLSCAGAFPPAPLGTAMLEAVSGARLSPVSEQHQGSAVGNHVLILDRQVDR